MKKSYASPKKSPSNDLMTRLAFVFRLTMGVPMGLGPERVVIPFKIFIHCRVNVSKETRKGRESRLRLASVRAVLACISPH